MDRKSSLSIKMFTVMTLILLLFVLATAQSVFASPDEQIELTVWFGRDAFIPADQFATFNEMYPNITITTDVVPLEEVVAAYTRAYMAGIAPDIIQVGQNAVGPLIARDSLMDMTEWFEVWKEEDPELYEDIAPYGWDLASWEGIPYGLGIHFGTNGSWFVYRKDVLERYGFDAPETWDDVLEIARAVKDEMTGFSLIGSRLTEPIWTVGKFMAMGGQFEDGIPQIDSEAGHYLIHVHQTLAREGLIHPETLAWDSGEMRTAFIGGRAAMAPIGWNIYPTIQEELPYKEKWDQIPNPYRPGAEEERKLMLIGWPYYVSAQTEHPYEASLVLRYLASPEIVSEVAKRYQPTSTMSVMDDPAYVEAKPWAAEKYAYMDEMEPMEVHLRASEMEDLWRDLLQESITNVDEDPADMARRYQEEMNKLIP